MIKREDLEPIMAPFLNDENSASVVESLAAIDIYPEADVNKSEWEKEKEAEIAKINKEWNDRFLKTFFGGKNEAAQVLAQESAQGNKEEDYVSPNEEAEEVFDIDSLLYKKEDE